MPLTKDQILSANDIKMEEVPVPEWGGSVYLKVMSAKQREAWETAFFLDKTLSGCVRTDLLARTLCDETGKELFTSEDIEALGTKDSSVIDMLFEKAKTINKMSKEDVDALGNA